MGCPHRDFASHLSHLLDISDGCCVGSCAVAAGRQRASAASIIKEAIAADGTFRVRSFESACARTDINRRLTKPRHPWSNSQFERMNRTIKDTTVRRDHYDSDWQLRVHLADLVIAYNFGRGLNTLCGLTPYEAICKAGTAAPSRFASNPLRQMPGRNI